MLNAINCSSRPSVTTVLEVLVGEFLEVLLAVSDGLGVAADQGGDLVQAAVPELGRLNGGVVAPVILTERPLEDLHGVLDIRGIGKANGHGFGPPTWGIWQIPYHRYKRSHFRKVDSASILSKWRRAGPNRQPPGCKPVAPVRRKPFQNRC